MMDARDMRSAKELMIRLREARLVGWDNRRSSNTLVSVDEVMAVEATEGSGCGFSCRSSCGSCVKSVCCLLGAVILFAATGEIIERSLNFFYQRSFSCLLLVGGSAFHRATNMQGGGDLFRSYKFVKYPADVGAPVRALREARVKGVYTGDGRDGGR